MYEVIKKFTDLQDGNHVYNVGDTYPHEGYIPSEERIAELASDKNRQRVPLIVEIPSEDAEEVEEIKEVSEDAESESNSRKRKKSE